MIYVLLSAIIFGLVHPGSKLILGEGVDLLSFCILYIGIRLIVQIPVILKTGLYRVQSRKQMLILLTIGLVGAALQMTEFMGIADGLPVPVVTFLVYTNPIWTLLLGAVLNNDKISGSSIFKIGLGIGGSAIIFLGHLHAAVGGSLSQLAAPVFAGLMIALWTVLSGKAKKGGASTWTVSFYYDLFALTSLLILRGSGLIATAPIGSVIDFLANPKSLLLISGYSIFVGLLPNLLFYRGTQNISALSCGLILLLEPVVATMTSSFAWGSPLPHLFFIGAGLVLLAGSPIENLPLKKWIKGFGSTQTSKVVARLGCAFAVLIFSSSRAEAAANTLHLLEVVPASESDYTNSKELKAIEVSSDFAIADFKAKFPACSFSVDKSLTRGNEEELFSKISKLAKDVKENEIVVGMTRSSFARVAASAAKGSNLKAISIGAATTNLAEINKNFVSIVSPWTKQWAAIQSEMTDTGCSAANTRGYFDSGDYLSRNFRHAFEEKFGAAQSFSIDDLTGTSKQSFLIGSCVFLAVNFSKAQAPLANIAKIQKHLTIIGIGDWNYFANELKLLLKTTTQSWRVSVPTGWTEKVSSASEAFAARYFKALNESPSPVAAYTYDATTVALFSICNRVDPTNVSVANFKTMGLLRSYEGLAESNNFLSPMQLVKFNGEKAL